jgi:hypothetical protein
MDMECVMELILVSEEKMDTNHKKMFAKMASFHEMIDAMKAELGAHHEKMIVSQEWKIAKMDAWLVEMKDG